MSLAEIIRNQAGWRYGKAEEYPEDARNLRSAKALDALADYVDTGEEAQTVSALDAHICEGLSIGGENVSRYLSRYGFDTVERDNPLAHIESLQELWIYCMEDAYEFAREQKEDWTGSLWPCEVQAAIDRITLPMDYWEHRIGRFESECEAYIEQLRIEQDKLDNLAEQEKAVKQETGEALKRLGLA